MPDFGSLQRTPQTSKGGGLRQPPPFETCDSTLRLAEQLGVGTRDLNQIEVVGPPIAKARFNFRRS